MKLDDLVSLTGKTKEEAERIKEYNENRHSQYCDAHPEYGCTTYCEEEYDELDEEAKQKVLSGSDE